MHLVCNNVKVAGTCQTNVQFTSRSLHFNYRIVYLPHLFGFNVVTSVLRYLVLNSMHKHEIKTVYWQVCVCVWFICVVHSWYFGIAQEALVFLMAKTKQSNTALFSVKQHSTVVPKANIE